VSSLECKLHILGLTWLKSSADGKDIKDFVDWESLGLLLSLFRLVFLLDSVEGIRLFLQETPFIVDRHL
jgi:hypothetical protein